MISAFCQLILRDFSRTFPAAFPELAFPKLFLMELFLRFSPGFAENKFCTQKGLRKSAQPLPAKSFLYPPLYIQGLHLLHGRRLHAFLAFSCAGSRMSHLIPAILRRNRRKPFSWPIHGQTALRLPDHLFTGCRISNACFRKDVSSVPGSWHTPSGQPLWPRLRQW